MGIFRKTDLGKQLLKSLAYRHDYWTEEIEDLEQVLMEKYGEEWGKKLTEIVNEIIEKELLDPHYAHKDPYPWGLMREYIEVFYEAMYMIEESEPFIKIIDYIKERLIEEIIQKMGFGE